MIMSVKTAKIVIKILALCLVGAISFFFLTEWLPETGFIEEAYESVEESSNTVMRFSAATLSASLAMSTFPDDFATPLAQTLSDMSIYFVAILAILFFEKILIVYGVKLAFAIAIPAACVIGIISVFMKKNALKSLAIRLCVLGLAIALVVPCSTHITNIVAADLSEYVDSTIIETEDGADKLNEVMESGAEDKNIFEKISDLFQTAIRGISDLLLHFQNTIRRCMNSIAILVLTNFVMPVLTFFILRWVLKETFNIAIPSLPPMKRQHPEKADKDAGGESNSELAVIGGKPNEE